MRRKAILVDIDGTLVSLTQFDYSVFAKADTETEEEKAERVARYLSEWDASTCTALVFSHAVEMLKRFKQEGYALVFLTARGQGCRKYTWRKLREINIDHMVDSMWHRPKRWEGISSSIYKEAMINRLSRKWDFHYAMDDEQKNLDVMSKFGMQVIDARTWWSCGCGHTVCQCR